MIELPLSKEELPDLATPRLIIKVQTRFVLTVQLGAGYKTGTDAPVATDQCQRHWVHPIATRESAREKGPRNRREVRPVQSACGFFICASPASQHK